MGLLLNRAKVNTTTTGTGTVNLGSAVSPFQSWSSAGAASGRSYSYLIEDGTAWEIGEGVYTSGSPDTLTRTLVASSTGSLLTLTGSATVACVANKDNHLPRDLCKFTKPLAADFGTSRSAGGSPSKTDPTDVDALLMTITRGASRQHSFYLKSAGVSAPYTVEAFIYAQYDVDDPFWWNGIAIGDTSANQHVYCGLYSNGTGILGPTITSSYLSSLTASETGGSSIGGFSLLNGVLVKMVNDGTNIKTYFSPDGFGRAWHLLGTFAISGNFTNGATMVGIHSGYVASTGTGKLWVPHFRVLPYAA